MWTSFLEQICRVGIFMICAQAMVHFRPQEMYEKYLKLLVSVMVLIQLFLPIGGLLLGGNGGEGAASLEQFGRDLEQSMQEAQENAAKTDALLEKMTLEELRNRVEAERGESVEDAESDHMNSGPKVETDSGFDIEPDIEIEIEPVEPVEIGRERESKQDGNGE